MHSERVLTRLLFSDNASQLFENFYTFSTTEGKIRALERDGHLDVRYAKSTNGSWGVLACTVPASYFTHTQYQVYVQLLLDSRKELVLSVMAAKCTCVNNKRKWCTHVAAALYTMQDMVFGSGRVPGEYSVMLSCTQKLQKWHRPVGNASPEDLEKDIELMFPFPSVKTAAKAENISAQKRDRFGDEAEESEGAAKKRANISQLYDSIGQMGIGDGIDMQEAKRVLCLLQVANLKAQLSKREARKKREAAKKEKEEAAKKADVEREKREREERKRKAAAQQARFRATWTVTNVDDG
jgi:hypothetical protein